MICKIEYFSLQRTLTEPTISPLYFATHTLSSLGIKKMPCK